MKKNAFLILLFAFLAIVPVGMHAAVTYKLSDFGLKPDTRQNTSPLFIEALKKIKQELPKGKSALLVLDKGRYDFFPEGAEEKEYYISNHDQTNPKIVGLPFENMEGITFDGQGSNLVFHGRMLPVSLVGSRNCTLKNFTIDFETPHICQVKILENDPATGTITFETAPWVNYEIRDGVFYHSGGGWELHPTSGIAFEEKTKRLVYNTSDIWVGTKNVTEISPRIIRANAWKNDKLIPGTVIALRSGYRPTPGIFISHDINTVLENIRIHYAEGMGLLAQMSENITLDNFSVCLKGNSDPRYFTTQADATHFSGCKGKIISKNGLYEGMMDDAINIHGTYLKVIKRINDRTLVGKYMHSQSYGFEWGRKGDAVQFIDSKTMELLGKTNRIASIRAVDRPTEHGAKEFEITFDKPVDPAISEAGVFGIENLEWTPQVVFRNNIIRNNRARGTLFSTPRKTLIENNLFDHTSGTAILLCGDCNGWFETGACRNVVIRNNRFINSLTNIFQFTNAVISIYPEIPDLKNQQKYFHSGIVIENNLFETFDIPILYAKSVDGLVFKNNEIRHNKEYPAFHWNKSPFFFQRVTHAKIKNNRFSQGFVYERDVKNE